MRKVYLFGLIETGLLVMGIEFVPPPWLLPILIGIFAVFGILTIWSSWHEIREAAQWVFNPGVRIYNRGVALQKREEALKQSAIKTRTANNIRELTKHPFMTDVTYDPVKREGSASLRPPHTWRDWLMRHADWLANHRMLPVWAWLWLGKRLGFKLKGDVT